jgi:hypothetical protein
LDERADFLYEIEELAELVGDVVFKSIPAEPVKRRKRSDTQSK